MKSLSIARLAELLSAIRAMRVLVVGDVILDRFVWGNVSRISPEAPVPVVDYDHESVMPGGAANVARNLRGLEAQVELFGIVGRDASGQQLRRLLTEQRIGCDALLPVASRLTSVKTRIIAHRQQVVRVDRETRTDIDASSTRRLLARFEARLNEVDAVIIGDYGKGLVTQSLIDGIRQRCRERGIWLSLDPKPVHRVDLHGLSLLTPNRKEAFELANLVDGVRAANPLEDAGLMRVAAQWLEQLQPALLLITLGDQGMLLCQRREQPIHIPTFAQEVFDVSGAGDTVIASFTLAIAAGASPFEAAVFSNHAAGVVVGKVGTATVSPDELRASFNR
jgi:D-glycero-beta-D-manno-heptose-7-phosphate kinase